MSKHRPAVSQYERELAGIRQYFNADASNFSQDRWRGSFVARHDRFCHFKFIARSLPPSDKPLIIVEAGAGSGDWASQFSHRCQLYLAIDLSEQMLRSPLYDRVPNCLRIQADVSRLPLPSNFANVIISSHCFEYIRNLRPTLLECQRVLHANGRLVIITKNRTAYPWRMTKRVLEMLRDNPIPPQFWRSASDFDVFDKLVLRRVEYIGVRLPRNPNDVHSVFPTRFSKRSRLMFGNKLRGSPLGKLLGWHIGLEFIKRI